MITDEKLADFAAALRRQAAGDVRTDALTRALYSLSLIHISSRSDDRAQPRPVYTS